MKKNLIVIAGPTASGKTALSVALAEHYNSVIFSADSRQFYKEISIGTAKPTSEEMHGIKHYFVDSHSIQTPLSVAQYVEQALPLLQKEFESHNTIILTGGSGMFIDALCYGLDEIPHSEELRQELTEFVQQNGLDPLLKELLKKDFEYYKQVDKNNPVRIIRAIEVIRLTGKTYTELRIHSTKKANKIHDFDIHYFVLNHPRETLYDRINQRVETMMEQGLQEEARLVYPNKHLQSLNTVGYSEIFDYFDGNSTLEYAIEMIQQNSRRYAKRQLTWFRRNEQAQWIDYTTQEEVIVSILKSIS